MYKRQLDNSENISPTLYSRLEKSFLSLPDVSSVHIYINNELIQEDQNVSTVSYTHLDVYKRQDLNQSNYV